MAAILPDLSTRTAGMTAITRSGEKPSDRLPDTDLLIYAG
ncbi:hypothetical protein IMSAGC021_00421 [Muribaculaceae bacterium]|nr:hypothetical protein IMSAGC021_00421 [Muribaculaceae bacterium]